MRCSGSKTSIESTQPGLAEGTMFFDGALFEMSGYHSSRFSRNWCWNRCRSKEKERESIKFPGFEAYVPLEKDEEHNNDPIKEAEVNELTKAEREFQEKKNKRNQNKKEVALRKRVKKRAQDMK